MPRGASKPVAGEALRGMAMGKLDQARRVAMQAAQQVHAIGEVSRGIQAGGLEQGIQVAMARRTVRGDARKMCLGYADR